MFHFMKTFFLRTALLPTLIAGTLLSAGCGADGWLYHSFEGQGYSSEEGLIGISPDDTLIVTATYLPVSQSGSSLFHAHDDAIEAHLAQMESGLVGFAVGLKLFAGEYRTLTVWTDEDAMYDFVMSEPHVSAMTDLSKVKKENGAATFATWEIKASELPLDWDDVVEHLNDRENSKSY